MIKRKKKGYHLLGEDRFEGMSHLFRTSAYAVEPRIHVLPFSFYISKKCESQLLRMPSLRSNHVHHAILHNVMITKSKKHKIS